MKPKPPMTVNLKCACACVCSQRTQKVQESERTNLVTVRKLFS